LSIFEEDNRCALIPDRRYDAEIRGDLSKGEYDRSKFTFDEQEDCYVCPQGGEPGRVAAVVVLKYRIVMRRGREKVKMEISLLCMLHNVLRIGKTVACAVLERKCCTVRTFVM